MTYNKKRFRELICYIISKITNRNHGKVQLLKLLYLCDFGYYEKYEKYLTGEKYKAIEGGPVPIHFKEEIKELLDEKTITKEEEDVGMENNSEKFFISKTIRPDEVFNEDEIKFIDFILEKFGNFSGGELCNMLHEDITWRTTKYGKVINYDLVLYRDNFLSVNEENLKQLEQSEGL